MSVREVKESPLAQGVDEEVVYSLTTTPWASTPSSPSVVVWLGGTDVTATVMPTGSASVSGDVITLPKLKSLTAERTYRVEVKFTAEGNVFEPYFIVEAE